MVGPLIRAPTIDPQPEPGGSQVRGSHWPRCAPGPHAAGKGRPRRGRTPPTSFSRAPAGRATALPAVGGSPLDWLPGWFIVSEAVFCMGGPLLTVGASWIAPAGHGSHGPTMYYTPDQAHPPAGGPVQEKPGKNNKPPGWWSSRKVWNPWGSVKLGER